MASSLNKKVLYLSYDGLTDQLGQSQILPYIIGLSKEYSFYIISFEKKQRFLNNNKRIENLCQQHKITWIPLLYTKHPPIFSTIYDIIRLYIRVDKLLKKEKISIIHCRSYITSLVGLSYKKKKNIKFIFDMRGFWADERMERNFWNPNNLINKLIYKYFKEKEKQFLHFSDKIISLTQSASVILLNLFPNIKHKIEVIPCATYFPKREKLILKDNSSKKRIVYIGSLRNSYLEEEMFLFFSLFQKKNADAVFCIYTNENKEYFLPYIRKYQLKQEQIHVEYVEHSEVIAKLSECDLGICFIKQTYSAIASSPTKFAEMLAANISVLCNNIGDLKEHCQQIPYTHCFDELNEEIFVNFINNFEFPNIEERKKISEAARKIYDLDLAIEKYFKVYKSLHD